MLAVVCILNHLRGPPLVVCPPLNPTPSHESDKKGRKESKSVLRPQTKTETLSDAAGKRIHGWASGMQRGFSLKCHSMVRHQALSMSVCHMHSQPLEATLSYTHISGNFEPVGSSKCMSSGP